MEGMLSTRKAWAAMLAGIVVLGLLSRAWRTGYWVWDKYAGDALYAAALHVVVRMVWWRAGWRQVAAASAVAMLGIEVFQLTGVAERMWASGSVVGRLMARVLGTTFGWRDLAAYGVGIGVVGALDRRR